MRANLPLFLSGLLLVGCGSSPTGLGSLGGNKDQTLTAQGFIDKSRDIERIFVYVRNLDDDEDGFFTPEKDYLKISPEVRKIADLNGDESVSVLEVVYLIKAGELEIDREDQLIKSNDSGPGSSAKFSLLKKQRDYYAANPTSQPYWENQKKVAELDLRLIEIAHSDGLADARSISELQEMRDYYNDPKKPPFDGLGDKGHQERLLLVANKILDIGTRKKSLYILTELRSYYEKAPNDGLGPQGHNEKIREINQIIDELSGGATPEGSKRP